VLVRVTEHLRLELADLRAGPQADVGEAAGELAVGVERLGVPARGLAGAHQFGDVLLAQRILGDERGQLGGGLVGAAQGRERAGARPAQAVAGRVQAAGLDGDGVVGQHEIGEGLAAPQRERLVARASASEGERRAASPANAAKICASVHSGAAASR
jgi:hypothetical protein